jgi:hypothetical protein
MTHEILRFAGPMGRRELVATAPGFEEAIELATERYEVLALDRDEDYPGCADFFTAAGEVYAIQPEGFAL